MLERFRRMIGLGPREPNLFEPAAEVLRRVVADRERRQPRASGGDPTYESPYLADVEKRASEAETTVEEILRRDREEARAALREALAVVVPSKACLDPFEIDRYVSGHGLSEGDAVHVQECPICRSMLAACPAQLAEAMGQQLATADAADEAMEPAGAGFGIRQKGFGIPMPTSAGPPPRAAAPAAASRPAPVPAAGRPAPFGGLVAGAVGAFVLLGLIGAGVVFYEVVVRPRTGGNEAEFAGGGPASLGPPPAPSAGPPETSPPPPSTEDDVERGRRIALAASRPISQQEIVVAKEVRSFAGNSGAGSGTLVLPDALGGDPGAGVKDGDLDPRLHAKVAAVRDAQRGQFEDALTNLGGATVGNDKDADLHVLRGDVYAEEENWDLALAEYEQAIRLNPDHAAAYAGRGYALAGKGDEGAAIDDYIRAIRLDPNNLVAYARRGLAYERQGDAEKAAADFAQCARLYGGSR